MQNETLKLDVYYIKTLNKDHVYLSLPCTAAIFLLFTTHLKILLLTSQKTDSVFR